MHDSCNLFTAPLDVNEETSVPRKRGRPPKKTLTKGADSQVQKVSDRKKEKMRANEDEEILTDIEDFTVSAGLDTNMNIPTL